MVVQQIQTQLTQLLSEFEEQVTLRPNTILVVGCSTSEVIGQKIGTAGALETAEAIFEPLQAFAKKHQLHLAFQGCEHINRALTMEAAIAEQFGYEPVAVVPVRTAGGSMSAYAYTQFVKPVVIETVHANAGIDIGQTLIGMHLKAVAVPVRTSVRMVGQAVVTVATTRPKLIGGERAVYM
ncbi:TIGR01440 family protein [Lysinibacillus parviboronicapiens]|uniref:TIGR01440 family protein n=1 Tax=Lysinibacillus parviboronicapiens TaxID=436516 RepID=UPI0006D1B533|nr:TIGR01440 family protein [Lysinibacillus parviboronicapiens]